ncbi:MAG: hypothetical protein ACXU85_09080, partial [Xanthobacteraceae bacterium]
GKRGLCHERRITGAPASRCAASARRHDGMKMRIPIALLAFALIAAAPRAQAAPDVAPCPGNAEALGTTRILPVAAATTPRVGRKHFPQTLPLAPKRWC